MQSSPKIVMPLNDESNAPLSSPHFNEEATVLSARPVVPLASSGSYAALWRATTNAPLVKRFLPMALIVAAAVGIGIAGGLALSGRHVDPAQAKSAVAANEPVSSTTAANATTTQTDPPAAGASETSNAPVQYTTTTAREKNVKPETQATKSVQPNSAAAARTATSEKSKQTNVEAMPQQQISLPPAATRNRRAQEVYAPDENDTRDDEARAERRAARAEQRRRAQATQPDSSMPPLPRKVERATQQLNRIKEIFEGQKP